MKFCCHSAVSQQHTTIGCGKQGLCAQQSRLVLGLDIIFVCSPLQLIHAYALHVLWDVCCEFVNSVSVREGYDRLVYFGGYCCVLVLFLKAGTY